ncbi:unnamed protein product [Bursaphelenchus xylophilus]|uniref:(pine wood nematode) hypothetical protein n=1 Tax=Bursaphelenchus xylophilus TaxID=6326 RepID=A0A1I7RRH4_BURXY|nr:unnamed protein product [Bursaphelenchus xylophilus]CAG9131040.1 unnamed protein product [Bursaphelenchus xylophilus]
MERKKAKRPVQFQQSKIGTKRLAERLDLGAALRAEADMAKLERSPMAIRCCYLFIAVGVFVFSILVTVAFFAFSGQCPGGKIPSLYTYHQAFDKFTEKLEQRTRPRNLSAEEESERLVRRLNEWPRKRWMARFNPDAVGMAEQKRLSDRMTEGNNITTDLYMVMTDMLNTVRLNGIFHQKYSKHLGRLARVIADGLPVEFDARNKWPECQIGRIYDQGGCGSCWAVSASSVMSDRICIRTSGKRIRLSAQKLIECCSYCGGCNGSVEPLMPFYYWYESGMVTEECYPYSVSRDCGYPCKLETYFKPRGVHQCSTTCQNGRTERRRHAEYVYRIGTVNGTNRSIMNSLSATYEHLAAKNGWPRQVDDLMLAKADLIEFGPFTVCFHVYEGFLHYYEGVYKRVSELEKLHVYDHCVKTIGWGKENGTEYFIAVNSWSDKWGKDGTFKIDLSMLMESRGDMYSAMADLNY